MINFLNSTAQHWFDWQFAMLWQTAVLIAIIWIIDLCIRKWAHPQVRYALWMLVLVKLLIPPTWTSPASVTSNIPGLAVRAAKVMEQTDNRTQPSYNSPPDRGEYPEGGRGFQSAQNINGERNPNPLTATRSASVPSNTEGSEGITNPNGQNTVAASAIPGTSASSQPSPSGTIQSRLSLHWQVYAMFTWLAGIIVLSFWLTIRLSGLRREHLNDNTAALPERFYAQLEETAAKLNLKGIPRVILTEKVACPAVFGIFRPILLMPATKFKTMTRQDTEHILLHELAHIKRGDLLVHAVYMIAQIAYWFNPLIWMARRPMQNLRELCCDATVAKLLRDKTVHYRQTLLETARQLLAEPVDPGLGLLGLFENNNWLVTRLQWLEKNTWKNRPLRIATIIALVAVMTTCVLPMANQPKKIATEDTENKQYKKVFPNGVTVELLGVCEYPDKDKQWWAPDGTRLSMQIKTYDSSDYPSDDPGYEFVFRKTGNESFKIHSVKGSNINSGLEVLKPAGLTGYRIHIKNRYRKTDIEIASPSGSWKTVHTATPQPKGSTSAVVNGKTLVLAAIKQAENSATVSCSDELGYMNATRIVAMDHAENEYTGQILADAGVNNVRQRTIRFVVPINRSIAKICFQICPWEYYTFKNVALRPQEDKRFKVTGTVTDTETGKPIPDAEVYDDGYDNNKCRTMTDENGNFTLYTANEEHNITAKAEGYQPQSKGLYTWPFANNKDFNFQLKKYSEAEFQQAEQFLDAVRSGDLSKIKEFISQGLDVYVTDRSGRTGLHEAGPWGQTEIAQFLIEQGADVNQKDKYGQTPLSLAAAYSHKAEPLAQLLIENGADVTVSDDKGMTPLHHACTASMCEMLVNKGADIHARDNRGWTPLHYDSNWGRLSAVRYLLENGADINALDKEGRTPLMLASANAYYHVVEYLLKQDADISAVDNQGRTALQWAAIKNEDQIRELLNGQRADGGESQAAVDKHYEKIAETIKILLANGADIEAIDNNGQNALDYAGIAQNKMAIAILSNTPNSELPTTNYSATLPNGVTVELLGVCEHPSEGKQWWQMDGTLLDKRPYPKMKTAHTHPDPGRKALEAAVKINGLADDIGFTFGITNTYGCGSCGTDDPKINAISFDQPQDAEITDIRIGVAAGKWQTIAQQKADFSCVISSGKVIWHGPTKTNGKTVLNMAHSVRGQQTRVIAVDHSGKEHTGGSTSATKEGLRSVQINFRLPLSKIKEFQFQTRPYEYVTFKNVALRLGIKTDVEIEIDDGQSTKDEETAAAGTSNMTTQNLKLETQNYKATLPNCVTVELLGVCETSDKKIHSDWWSPDGKPLSEELVNLQAGMEQVRNRYPYAWTLMYQLHGQPQDPTLTNVIFQGEVGSSESTGPYSGLIEENEKKINLDGTGWITIGSNPPLDSKNITLGISTDNWQVIATHPAQETDEQDGWKIREVAWKTEIDIPRTLLITNGMGPGYIVAIKKSGEIYKPIKLEATSKGYHASFTPTLQELKEIQIRKPIYEWVTFKNVALRPGVKTDVEIETQPSTPTPQVAEEKKMTLHGYVTDTLGRPRENVEISPSLSDFKNSKRTDQNGQFSFELDDPSQITWVAYSQPTNAVALFTIPKEYNGQSLHVPLDLTSAKIAGRIVGSDGKGLANRKMELLITTDQGLIYQSQCYGKTDQYGCYDSSIPCGDGLTVQTKLADADESEKNYASKKIALKNGQIYVEIPTFVVGQGNPEISDDDGRVHYSGRILNEDKKPIEGVEVKLSYNMPGHMGIWGEKVMTDQEGRWSCGIPVGHSNMYVRLIHPEYISFHFDQSARKPSTQELLNGTNVMILKRGHRLTGIIKDSQGKPVENALIAAGRLYGRSTYGEIHEDATTARTTSDGTFTIGGLPEKTIDVMISAAGYAPVIKAVEIKQDMEPIEATLEKGITYTGQVIDVDRNPLEGVKVDVGDWRIGNERHSLTRITQTDARGYFAIDNLPLEGTLRLDFGKRKSGLLGFSKEIPKDLTERDQIIMYIVPKFVGQVIDAETGKPVTRYEVTNGIKSEGFGDSIDWSRYYKEQVKSEDGSFNRTWQGYHISYPFDGACYLKIQAEGYLPEITPPVQLGKEYEPFIIKLSKAEIRTGTVVDEEGNPAANAQVGWLGPQQKAFIIKGQFDTTGFTYQTDKIVKTNSQGQFELQPSKEAGLIVVLHENGYATLASEDFKSGGQIQLTPWATITGVIVPDESGNTENTISVSPVISNEDYQTEKVRWRFDSISLSQNNFTINYVPSIPLHVGKIIRWEQDNSIYLNPQPGQNYNIQIGGEGQTVTGRITTPNTPEGRELAKAMTDPRQVHAAAFLISPADQLPEEITDKTHSSFLWLWQNAKDVYLKSTKFHKRFIPTINEKGEFKFENLSPGKYEFVVNVHLPLGENVSCGRGVLKGINVVPFDVAENAKEIQIPDIKLKMLQYPVAGEAAPDFQAKTFDGKTINLSDFRGKVVLLDFWATWCRPCVDQLPKLSQLYDEFGSNEHFAMISLSVDWDVEEARQMVFNKGLPWHQVSLGSMAESTVVKDYGVGAIPALILIDPEGEIIAQDISPDDLKSTIQKALGDNAPLHAFSYSK